MRHLVYTVRCSVVPINSSLLTKTLHSFVIALRVYNDTWRFNRVRLDVSHNSWAPIRNRTRYYWTGPTAYRSSRREVLRTWESVANQWILLTHLRNTASKHNVNETSLHHTLSLFVCLFLARQPPVGQGLLIHEVSRLHTTQHRR